jgi:acyl-CoA hydrolase
MPRMRRGPRLLLCEADMVLEVECPLVTAPEAATSQTLQIIARQVADLIPHGAAIQAGIGGAPGALWPHLRAHRDLTLRSGMANEDLRDLAESGALRPGGDHRVGIAYGSSDFYRYLADSDLVAFDTTIATHGHAALAGVSRLHAVNSALEIDLLGQVNSEWQDGRLTSGVGGAIDFARAARASAGGRSIIALPATAKQAAVSRIVTRLQVPASMARSDIDTVVTEHGVAMIRNLGLDARAEALIAIAAPGFRSQLREEWSRVRPQI